MVLSDDGEMTLPVLLSSADPPADVTQPGILASVRIATNLSHCHDENILSQVYYRELSDPEKKSTRILLVGVLELNMVLSIIYFVIQIYQYSNILFILEPLPLLYICNAIPPLCKGLD